MLFRSHQKLATSFALGHLDQWVRGKPYQPFMVGLTMAALIEAYEASGDVRIPPALQKMLDRMWDEAWSRESAAFSYRSDGSAPAADLNMLIAPAYAWFYRISGEGAYLERGDQIFNGGVARAWLAGGKQFSQNYRWSFDYLKWAGPGNYRPPSGPQAVRPPAEVPRRPVCEPRLPTLAISPPKIAHVRTGRAQLAMAEYEVTVSNNDNSACGIGSFSLSLSPVRPTSMELNLSDVRLKLAPGQSSKTRVLGIFRQRSAGTTQLTATLSGSSLGAVSASQ